MKIPVREKESFSEKKRKKSGEILRKTETRPLHETLIPGMKKAKAFRLRLFLDLYLDGSFICP